jgi:hypothetical protein
LFLHENGQLDAYSTLLSNQLRNIGHPDLLRSLDHVFPALFVCLLIQLGGQPCGCSPMGKQEKMKKSAPATTQPARGNKEKSKNTGNNQSKGNPAGPPLGLSPSACIIADTSTHLFQQIL